MMYILQLISLEENFYKKISFRLSSYGSNTREKLIFPENFAEKSKPGSKTAPQDRIGDRALRVFDRLNVLVDVPVFDSSFSEFDCICLIRFIGKETKDKEKDKNKDKEKIADPVKKDNPTGMKEPLFKEVPFTRAYVLTDTNESVYGRTKTFRWNMTPRRATIACVGESNNVVLSKKNVVDKDENDLDGIVSASTLMYSPVFTAPGFYSIR